MNNTTIFINKTKVVIAEYPLAVVRYTTYIGKTNTKTQCVFVFLCETDCVSHKNLHRLSDGTIKKPSLIKTKREAPKLLSAPAQKQARKKTAIPVIKISVNLTSIVSVIDLYLKYEHQIQSFISNLF